MNQNAKVLFRTSELRVDVGRSSQTGDNPIQPGAPSAGSLGPIYSSTRGWEDEATRVPGHGGMAASHTKCMPGGLLATVLN